MSNKEIARQFNLLAKLMELHEENPFKIRSYSNAYLTLRRIGDPLSEMTPESVAAIRGIGKAIGDKIQELVTTGEMETLNRYISITPPGIIDILQVKGLGAKKVKTLWHELGIESAGELLYACKENRLIELKGFGAKTQADIEKQLSYFLDSKGKYLYATVEPMAFDLIERLEESLMDVEVSLVGALRRKLPIVESIEILVAKELSLEDLFNNLSMDGIHFDDGILEFHGIPLDIYFCSPDSFASNLFELTGSNAFLDQFEAIEGGSEEEIFDEAGLPYLEPELRENEYFFQLALEGYTPDLVSMEDIKGVVHNHSSYSDGIHTLSQMSNECQRLGYEYFVISDHSKSAFYANGLSVDRVYQQWKEIDDLNASQPDFKIYKSIESDILGDGSLDYEQEILNGFDLVISSIHSNLKMDMDKATSRLIKAIEHPSTRILGHPTGRLLLARKGYPIDFEKVIDACAANHVVIELNANPLRLDLDWEWIPYALEKEVMISINPDAHSMEGIKDIYFGVCAARKGGLTAEMCLNAMTKSEFDQWLASK